MISEFLTCSQSGSVGADSARFDRGINRCFGGTPVSDGYQGREARTQLAFRYPAYQVKFCLELSGTFVYGYLQTGMRSLGECRNRARLLKHDPWPIAPRARQLER